MQGTLAAEGLDLTPYVSTVRLLTSGERGWDRKPISLDGLDGIDVDLRLSAARVNIAHARLGRTAVAAHLRGGNLTLPSGRPRPSAAWSKARSGSRKSHGGADFKAQLQFTNIDLERSLGEMFGIRRLEGKGNLSFAIESSGASVYDLTKALNGTAALSSRRGAIAGFNVEQLLRRIERRPLSGGGEFRTGKTPYETLTVNLKIVQGVANVEDVRMEGSTVGLALNGSASIPERELDLHGTASLLSNSAAAASAAAPAFELPFIVQGPWDDPIMLPDPQSRIQRSGAAAPLLDAVRNLGPRDAVRSAIERLTGAAPTLPAPPAGPSPPPAGSPLADGMPAVDPAPAPAESTTQTPPGTQ